MSRPQDLRTFVTEETRLIRATPDVVIAQLRSPDSRAKWQSEIVRLTGPDGLSVGDSVEGVADMLGFLVEGQATTTELARDHYEEDVIVGVRMRIRFEVAPDGDGVLVKHTLTSKLPGGLSGRVLSALLKGRLRKMQRDSLANLKDYAESGPPS